MSKLQSKDNVDLVLKKTRTFGIQGCLSDRLNTESREQKRTYSAVLEQALIEYFYKLDQIKLKEKKI